MLVNYSMEIGLYQEHLGFEVLGTAHNKIKEIRRSKKIYKEIKTTIIQCDKQRKTTLTGSGSTSQA
ncbi:hypothetical protein HanRHA438_Chr01g0034481 [Helianthus annuus]|nr:hypothetical protein HanRHA438_Chr01g0034481 [Helianthus annuus]